MYDPAQGPPATLHSLLGPSPPGGRGVGESLGFFRASSMALVLGGLQLTTSHGSRPIDRVLRMATVVMLGLLRTTSMVKALAVCGWLPADLATRFELVRFILRQWWYRWEDMLTTDYSPGCKPGRLSY